MGQVVVTINGRAFQFGCADGEEPRIRRLAQYVEGKVAEFADIHGQVGEARLILLAAIVIADELSDTNDLYQRERVRIGAAPASGAPAAAVGDATVDGIRNIARRIDSIAARLEST
jgi:cell division protein ZapA